MGRTPRKTDQARSIGLPKAHSQQSPETPTPTAKRGIVAKGAFGLTYNKVREDKESTKKKSLVLKEKREGDNNPSKVHNLRETHLQKIRGVLLHLP